MVSEKSVLFLANIKAFKIVTLGFILIFFISCESNPIDKIENKISSLTVDTLTIDIPDHIRMDSFLQQREDKWVRTLGLPSLKKGSKDFQLRLWEDTGMSSGRVLTIGYKNEVWQAGLWAYLYKSTEFSFPDSLVGLKLLIESPKSGWNNFMNQLINLNILDLTDYENLQDYDIGTDALSVKVEIAWKKYYKFYEYMDLYWHKYPSTKKMVQITQLVKKEFPSIPNEVFHLFPYEEPLY